MGKGSVNSSAFLGGRILDVKGFLSLVSASVSWSVEMAVASSTSLRGGGSICSFGSAQDSPGLCLCPGVVSPFTLRDVLIWRITYRVTLLVGEHGVR